MRNTERMIELKRSSILDPNELAANLVRKQGMGRARQIAMKGTLHAQKKGDFYILSVWREAKNLLNRWTEDAA